MGDSLRPFCSSKKLEPKVIITTKNQPADSLLKGFSQKTLQCVTSTKHGLIGNGVVGDIGLFIVKTAALEIVRRYTSAKCPVVWRGLQALQVLCYPPFKWIEKWTPLKALVKYMQSLSKPLLVLTIATVFLINRHVQQKKWIVHMILKHILNHNRRHLHNCQLQTQGLVMKSLKVCLPKIGCNNSIKSLRSWVLLYQKVSQVEHGVMHLINVENPQITVLMDCEGLSPFGFPMQMLRSCALLLQDHYPNRLGYLIIIQLPAVARVITQTLFQVMRPTTQQKFRIVGENYQKVLLEYLQSLPPFLGGKYYCLKYSDQVVTHNMNEEIVLMRPSGRLANNENVPSLASHHLTGNRVNQDSNQIMRIVIISILMMWIFIAFVLAKQYPDYLSLLKWHSGP